MCGFCEDLSFLFCSTHVQSCLQHDQANQKNGFGWAWVSQWTFTPLGLRNEGLWCTKIKWWCDHSVINRMMMSSFFPSTNETCQLSFQAYLLSQLVICLWRGELRPIKLHLCLFHHSRWKGLPLWHGEPAIMSACSSLHNLCSYWSLWFRVCSTAKIDLWKWLLYLCICTIPAMHWCFVSSVKELLTVLLTFTHFNKQNKSDHKNCMLFFI